MSSTLTYTPLTDQASRLSWLTPVRCRTILGIVLVSIFAGNVWYLNHNCPIDLGGDEAQYWDWSRQLDPSYYSKGPAIAYIIRASCAIFGDTMPAVRYPALLFAAATSIVTYLLTLKLFKSERLALGAALLLNILPIFIVGGVLMTIDPPMFFCWAVATYFAAIAIFDNRKWAWIFVGIAIGLGFLAKYSEFLWFAGLFAFLLRSRRRKSADALIGLIVAAFFTLPVLIWNYRNNWLSLHHVARQIGASEGAFSVMNVLEFIGGQIAIVGPTLAVLMVAAIVYKSRRPRDDRLGFLMWIGLPFFVFNLIDSFRTKVQLNWPAPAYFTLIILTAYFLATRHESVAMWKRWRGWLWATIVVGLVFMPLAHDASRIVSLITSDPLERLRGWARLGRDVTQQLHEMPPGTFIMCDDYQQTAEMAFYVENQPATYCAGSYFGKRWSQYDVWPDRRLDPDSPLVGRSTIYVGKGGNMPLAVAAAFERVEKQPPLDIEVSGVKIRSFKTWRCYGFKGMQRPAEPTDY